MCQYNSAIDDNGQILNQSIVMQLIFKIKCSLHVLLVVL